jgi:N-acetyl-anhydromuramyl-L-alanine amidase AmpD
MPSAKIDPSKPIPIDPLLKQGEGTNWREQQLAKQAAEQKAREEEQRKLQNALHRFLFKDDAAR